MENNQGERRESVYVCVNNQGATKRSVCVLCVCVTGGGVSPREIGCI